MSTIGTPHARSGLPYPENEQCDRYCGRGARFRVLTERGDEQAVCCAECAPRYLLRFEDSDGVIADVGRAADIARELGDRTRQWDRVARDHRALTAEVIAGLTTDGHAMTAVAGLPVCACGLPLGGGDASGVFITHALAKLKES